MAEIQSMDEKPQGEIQPKDEAGEILDKLMLYIVEHRSRELWKGKSSYEPPFMVEDKTIHLLHGEHGSFKAASTMRKEVFPKVLEEPQAWVFLIEGASEGVKSPMLGLADRDLALLVAARGNIPLEDPIVNMYQKEVVEEAEAHGLKKEKYYMFYLKMLLCSLSKQA